MSLQLPVLSDDAGPMVGGRREQLLRMSTVLEDPDDEELEDEYKNEKKNQNRARVHVCADEVDEMFAGDDYVYDYSQGSDDDDANSAGTHLPGSESDNLSLTQRPESYTASKYQAVQQLPWEGNIIWDEEEEDTDDDEEEDDDADGQKDNLGDSSRKSPIKTPVPKLLLQHASKQRVRSLADTSSHNSNSKTSFASKLDRAVDKRDSRANSDGSKRWGVMEDQPGVVRARFDEGVQDQSPSHRPALSPLKTMVPPKVAELKSGVKNLKKPLPPTDLNKRLAEGDWLQAVVWDDQDSTATSKAKDFSKLILDENDVNMIFEDPEAQQKMVTPSEALEFAVADRPPVIEPTGVNTTILDEKREYKRQRDARMLEFWKKHNMAGGTGEEYGQWKLGKGRGKKATRKRGKQLPMHHSQMAQKLSRFQGELNDKKLRDWHRPRLRFIPRRPAVLTLMPKVVNKKASRKRSFSSTGGVAVNQVRKLTDLHYDPADDGSVILVEYVEQYPPLLSATGMASRLYNYWKQPGMSRNSSTGIVKASAPRMPEGTTITLTHHDASPFIGEIPSDGKVYQALCNHLATTPLFRHESASTDFLVVKRKDEEARDVAGAQMAAAGAAAAAAAAGGGGGGGGAGGAAGAGAGAGAVSITSGDVVGLVPIKRLFVAAQQEPQRMGEVTMPNSKAASNFMRAYLSFHILRLFRKKGIDNRLQIAEVETMFPSQSYTLIRLRMATLAEFKRGGDQSGYWVRKHDDDLTEETFRESHDLLTPENVCLYESMMAAERRLRDLGMQRYDMNNQSIQDGVDFMIKRLKAKKHKLEIDKREFAKEQAKRSAANMEYQLALKQREEEVADLSHTLTIARHLLEQRRIAPWNLTGNFVRMHLSKGLLKLTGMGDPSGCGDGFSFLRESISRAKKKKDAEENGEEPAFQENIVAKGADLRKLKMPELVAIMKNFGMKMSEIEKLTRWERVSVVRELSGKAHFEGRAGALAKYARGARTTFAAQQQDYNARCTQIWARQARGLQATAVEEEDSDDSDDDDMFMDIESELLEEQKHKEGDKKRGIAQGVGGAGGMRIRNGRFELADATDRDDYRQYLRLQEELLEDMEREQSSDDDAEKKDEKKKKGKGKGKAKGKDDDGSDEKEDSDKEEAAAATAAAAAEGGNTTAKFLKKKKVMGSNFRGKRVLKRTTVELQDDGTEKITVQFFCDAKSVREYELRKLKEEEMDEDGGKGRKRRRQKKYVSAEEEYKDMTAKEKRKLLDKKYKDLQIKNQNLETYMKMAQSEKGKKFLQNKQALYDETGKKLTKCTACGIVGHMSTNRNCPLYDANNKGRKKSRGGSGSSYALNEDIEADGLKLTIKRGAIRAENGATSLSLNINEMHQRAAESKKQKRQKRIEEQRAQGDSYKRPPLATSKTRGKLQRLPLVQLNAHLETVLYTLWNDDRAGQSRSELFKEPVDLMVVDGYSEALQAQGLSPIALRDILNKITRLEYRDRKQFLEDVTAIKSNCACFNGKASPYTKAISELVSVATAEVKSMKKQLDSIEKLLNK